MLSKIIPEISNHELYCTLSILKFCHVYNYHLRNVTKLATNDRLDIFEELCEINISLQNYRITVQVSISL